MNEQDLMDLLQASALAGFNVPPNADLQLQVLESGLETHITPRLLPNHSAIYLFKLGQEVLKVGHCGINCNPCFQSRHYGLAFDSTLARSLLNYEEWNEIYNEENISNWIKHNTTRYNIYIPQSYGNYFRYFAESFFILKYKPKFERRGN